MLRRTAIVAVAAFAMGGLVGAVALSAGWLVNSPASGTTKQPGWTEVQWPFPTDQFGRGKAFTCAAGSCGTPVTLYVRAKIGFCNCTEGVADDAELERIGDLELLGGKAAAQGDGRRIAVASMKGRSRSYALTGTNQPARSALSIGYNERCDGIVAMALVPHDRPADVEPKVVDFLAGPTVMRWLEVTLGL